MSQKRYSFVLLIQFYLLYHFCWGRNGLIYIVRDLLANGKLQKYNYFCWIKHFPPKLKHNSVSNMYYLLKMNNFIILNKQ